MTTKYILEGGAPYRAQDGGRAFVGETLKGFEEPIKLLVCYFAVHRFRWEIQMVVDRWFFNRRLGGKKVEYQIAHLSTFIAQLCWANVLYLKGGDTPTLLRRLATHPDWKNKLEGKTVVGSSAGAMAIAKHRYDVDHFKLADGLGLVPVKVLVHYRSGYNGAQFKWDAAESELRAYGENVPLVTLGEGEFKVFSTNGS